jgi:hypothetical protein
MAFLRSGSMDQEEQLCIAAKFFLGLAVDQTLYMPCTRKCAHGCALQAQAKDASCLEQRWRLALSGNEVLKHKIASDITRHTQEINSLKRKLAAASTQVAHKVVALAEKDAEVCL